MNILKKNNRLFFLLIIVTALSIINCDKSSTAPNNKPPTASFSVTPDHGNINTIFTVDAGGSSDSEDDLDSLLVRWDWENDMMWDTDYSLSKTATHMYHTPT